ncbi:hypothetical protein F443_13838 [Phytophthora nicotianae P1569]|uniref:Uncharacterized protein n=1 Tax=Phytophthora nicotianae P1569 TaxID=1317065 RepID=V9EQY0_PHYNI|nr:hypothetical protein F443_13838 [Phytophthora nicotianae P1569]
MADWKLCHNLYSVERQILQLDIFHGLISPKNPLKGAFVGPSSIPIYLDSKGVIVSHYVGVSVEEVPINFAEFTGTFSFVFRVVVIIFAQ